MSILDSPLTTAQLGPNYQEQFPLPRDNVSILRTEMVAVNQADYVPLAIGTPNPDNPTVIPPAQPGPDSFYLMEETPRRYGPGPVFQFERIWHNVWQARQDWETYAYQHPEFRGKFPFLSYSVLSETSALGVMTITLASDHAISVGDLVVIGLTWGYQQGATEFRDPGQVGRYVTGVPAVNQIEVDDIPMPSWATTQLLQTATDYGGPVRQGFTKVVNSQVFLDYWIVGVTDDPANPGTPIADPGDIPIIPREFARNELLAEVAFYGSFTTPTQEQFQAKIDAGDLIVSEASQINELGGNLYERRTRYVVAA